MKYFIFTFLLCFSLLKVNAQTQKLDLISTGELLESFVLYTEDEEVFGYAYFYDLGKYENYEHKFEYIIIDRNLNKLTNAEFRLRDYGDEIETRFSSAKLIGDEMYFVMDEYTPSYVYMSIQKIQSSYMKVNLKTKEFSERYYQIDDKFETKVFKDGESSINLEPIFSHYFSIHNENGQVYFLVHDNEGEENKPNYLKIFNDKHELLWTYDVGSDKKEKKIIVPLNVKNNRVFIRQNYLKFDKKHTLLKEDIKVFDLQNGKQIFAKEINNASNEFYTFHQLSVTDDKYELQGIYVNNSQTYAGLRGGVSQGISNLIFDLDGNLVSSQVKNWNEIDPKLEMKNGKDKDKFELYLKRIFNFENGSKSILLEKAKGSKNIKIKDFVILNFDAKGNFINTKIITKDLKRNYSDYIFSQLIKDKSAVLLFYRDYDKEDTSKDKDWTLNISKIEKGQFIEESIIMRSKNYIVLPTVAKEGYILLREFNKDEKKNQLRLERLNVYDE